MMATDLSDPEIVLGKLGSRLAPILGLIACGVPVAALATLLGGVEFGAIAGLFVISVSLAVLGCTLALTVSVWAAKTHEVLMAVYMFGGLWLLALPIWEGLSVSEAARARPCGFRRPTHSCSCLRRITNPVLLPRPITWSSPECYSHCRPYCCWW